jgi:SAM-dependent methyltransferase
MAAHSSIELENIYRARFVGQGKYRQRVWDVLCSFFSKWIPENSVVLDLGCGYCEFINAITAREKYAMDMNPDSAGKAGPDVRIILQDCAVEWPLHPETLDVVFTSNFFEHLSDKPALERTLKNIVRSLRPGGKLIMMGPNAKFVPGAYWDFFDHYIPLTERSLSEVAIKCGFEVELCVDRFLPYTMSQGRRYPLWMLKAYLELPWAWRIFGKQFLLVARKS